MPSRASFGTGRHIHQTGYWDNALAYNGSTPGCRRLLLEYDPAAPFDAGAPDKAGEAATRMLRRFAWDSLGACREAAIRIGCERLGIEDD